MSRSKLPERRPNQTTEIDHAGFRFTVTIGFALGGQPLEVFADGVKLGSDMGHVISDACVAISLALQFGCPADNLTKSMGLVPDPARGEAATRAASVIGAIADEVVRAARPLRC